MHRLVDIYLQNSTSGIISVFGGLIRPLVLQSVLESRLHERKVDPKLCLLQLSADERTHRLTERNMDWMIPKTQVLQELENWAIRTGYDYFCLNTEDLSLGETITKLSIWLGLENENS